MIITPLVRKRIVLGLLGGLAILILANAGYFWMQLTYRLRGPQPVSLEETVTEPALPPKAEPDRLVIESLGIQAPLVYIEERTEAAYQKALQRGVVHYPGTALPGQPGNAYFFGHSSDYAWAKGEYKRVFALLPSIKIGETIKATDREGYVYTYKVVETRIVEPKDRSVLDQHGKRKRLLSLQTSYPIGTALRRFVVVAELVTPP